MLTGAQASVFRLLLTVKCLFLLIATISLLFGVISVVLNYPGLWCMTSYILYVFHFKTESNDWKYNLIITMVEINFLVSESLIWLLWVIKTIPLDNRFYFIFDFLEKTSSITRINLSCITIVLEQTHTFIHYYIKVI